MKVLHSKGVKEDKGQRVFLAVPSYGGICSETVYSLFGSKEALLRNNIESELEIFSGNCHVDDGRNRLVRDFLETDCTDFVFIDTDVRFDPEDLVKLVLYDRDVVAGIYPLKQEDEEYPVRFLGGDIQADSDGLVEVESVPTGFLRIKRHVLEKLYESVPKFRAKQDNPNTKSIPLIFERTLEGTIRWGGDYEFCRKWRGMGGKIYIDPEMTFGHIGSREWSGSLGTYLRKINGLTDEYIKIILRKIAEGTETERDIFKLVEAWDNVWSVRADFIISLIAIARETNGPILECGSGLTTLVLKALGKRVVSLEHDKEWFDRMLEMGVNENSPTEPGVVYAPIKQYNGFKWYDFTKIPLIYYELAVIDGPPRQIGREGFLKLMPEYLVENGLILADDAGNMQDWEKALNTKLAIMGDGRKYAVGRIGKLKEVA